MIEDSPYKLNGGLYSIGYNFLRVCRLIVLQPKLIFNPRKLCHTMCVRGYISWLSDVTYVKVLYWSVFGEKLDLNAPKTYCEKLQWIKLFDRNPQYTQLVDKLAVRDYIKEKIGEEYLIPLLGVWDSFDDINFSQLPDKFVLKCTHDSGSVAICKDKNSLDYNQIRRKFESALRTNYFYIWREWPYKNVCPKIIAEKYTDNPSSGELVDYKFYCFNGEIKMLLVVSGRNKDIRYTYFTKQWDVINMSWGYGAHDKTPEIPINYDKMISIVELLSRNIKHVRVDLYNVNGKIYFGEMTFFDAGGLIPPYPQEYDFEIGSWINLE